MAHIDLGYEYYTHVISEIRITPPESVNDMVIPSRAIHCDPYTDSVWAQIRFRLHNPLCNRGYIYWIENAVSQPDGMVYLNLSPYPVLGRDKQCCMSKELFEMLLEYAKNIKHYGSLHSTYDWQSREYTMLKVRETISAMLKKIEYVMDFDELLGGQKYDSD